MAKLTPTWGLRFEVFISQVDTRAVSANWPPYNKSVPWWRGLGNSIFHIAAIVGKRPSKRRSRQL